MSAPSKICPVCAKPLEYAGVAARFAPFCSRRCADLDLGRWLKGGYAIPGAPDEPESASQAPAQDIEEE